MLSSSLISTLLVFFNPLSSVLCDTANPQTSAITYNPVTYRGWSSWSMQAFRGQGYGYRWLTETNVKAQAEVLAKEFSGLGYDRINLDSGWQDPNELDQHGRNILSKEHFPNGIENLQSFLAQRSFKLGLYYLPGIDARAVDKRMPVLGTKYTADEIVQCPGQSGQQASGSCRRPLANAFGAGVALNYSHPGSQMFINSIVDGFYQWNVSFVRLDGVVPGSQFTPTPESQCDTSGDLTAWRRAIEERHAAWPGREKIWLVASWSIPTTQTALMDRTSNSWRVAQDINAYGQQTTTFDRVVRNLKGAAPWTSTASSHRLHGLLDMDAVLVSDMSLEESRTMVSLWAILGSPFYLGDDLVRLPAPRKALLKNPEVLALQRLAATNPARLNGFNSTGNAVHVHGPPTSKVECSAWAQKRFMIVGLAGIAKVDSEAEFSMCWAKATTLLKMKSEKMSGFDGPVKNSEGSEDDWRQQVWALRTDKGEIFLAVVNAGRQTADDAPASITVKLSELDVLKGTSSPRQKFQMRDVWKGQDLGLKSFGEQITFQLDVHATALMKFTPA